MARVVNDAVSDAARPALLPLAPRMIGTAGAGESLSVGLVEHSCRTALAVALPLWLPRLRRDLRRAQRGQPFTTRRAAGTVVLATASLALGTHLERDRVLSRLLSDATRLAETMTPRRAGGAPFPRPHA
jgi:hypothetical protein